MFVMHGRMRKRQNFPIRSNNSRTWLPSRTKCPSPKNRFSFATIIRYLHTAMNTSESYQAFSYYLHKTSPYYLLNTPSPPNTCTPLQTQIPRKTKVHHQSLSNPSSSPQKNQSLPSATTPLLTINMLQFHTTNLPSSPPNPNLVHQQQPPSFHYIHSDIKSRTHTKKLISKTPSTFHLPRFKSYHMNNNLNKT